MKRVRGFFPQPRGLASGRRCRAQVGGPMGGANLQNASKGLKRQESWGFLKAQNDPQRKVERLRLGLEAVAWQVNGAVAWPQGVLRGFGRGDATEDRRALLLEPHISRHGPRGRAAHSQPLPHRWLRLGSTWRRRVNLTSRGHQSRSRGLLRSRGHMRQVANEEVGS